MNVSVYDSLQALPSGYARLFDDWSTVSYNYSLPWFQNLVETAIEPHYRVRLFGLEVPDRARTPVAILPAKFESRPAGLLEPRRLSALGNYYSSLFGPMIDRTVADRVGALDALVDALCQDRPQWDIIDLTPMDRDAPLYTELQAALQRRGLIVQPYRAFGNWYLEVGGRSYAEYVKGLPSVLKKNIPYYTRKLHKSFQARLDLITTSDGIDEALQAYDTVYRKSWKLPEPHPHFIPGLARTALKNGWLRLGIAYLDGTPAAAQLWFVHAGIASIFKVSYDERFAKHSVGTVLTGKIMEHVLDIDKVHTVDFLSGDDSYKKHWMSHRRERWGLYAMNPRTFNGCLSVLRHVGGRAVSSLLAAMRPTPPAPAEQANSASETA